MPGNHYGIFEKTRCPRVNEIRKSLVLLLGQIPSLSTVSLPFLFHFNREAGSSYISLYHLKASPRGDWKEGLSKDISLRVQKSFDSFERELLAKCVSEAFRWQKHLEESCDLEMPSMLQTRDRSTSQIWLRCQILVQTSLRLLRAIFGEKVKKTSNN